MVEVLESPLSSPRSSRLIDATAVIIDVLRASTTVVRALQSGARAVVPVESPEQALHLRSTIPGALACGERGGLRPDGFDLGNSPLEYTPQAVRGRTILLTTSNGVRLFQSLSGAHSLCWGSLLNARDAAAFIVKQDRPAIIGCAGTDNRLALEDVIGAGAVVHELLAISAESISALDDAARAALVVFRAARADLHEALLHSSHARTLVRLGFSEDIALASKLNASTGILPILRDGLVTL